MKEKELIALGFLKCYGEDDQEGWYYYTYDFGRGFSLITNASDELVDGKWFVELFEDNNIRFTNSTDVMALIDLIKRNTKK
jgi:hypothetical protein